jgi:hypothetical protein
MDLLLQIRDSYRIMMRKSLKSVYFEEEIIKIYVGHFINNAQVGNTAD